MRVELERRDPRPDFDAEFRERFYTLLQWRRDVSGSSASHCQRARTIG